MTFFFREAVVLAILQSIAMGWMGWYPAGGLFPLFLLYRLRKLPDAVPDLPWKTVFGGISWKGIHALSILTIGHLPLLWIATEHDLLKHRAVMTLFFAPLAHFAWITLWFYLMSLEVKSSPRVWKISFVVQMIGLGCLFFFDRRTLTGTLDEKQMDFIRFGLTILGVCLPGLGLYLWGGWRIYQNGFPFGNPYLTRDIHMENP